MADDKITRKDIITDEAIKWGSEYVKELEKAIAKNKEFVDSLKSLNEATGKGRGSNSVKEFTEEQKKASAEAAKANAIFKAQIQIEANLTATKEKTRLATSESSKELVRARIEAQQTTKEIKQSIQEETSAYAKLNNERTRAKQVLLDLVAAEGLESKAVKEAQKNFDTLDKKVKEADHAAQDYTKSVGNYENSFKNALSSMGNFGGAIGNVTQRAIGFVQQGKDVKDVISGISEGVVTAARTMIGFGDAQKANVATTRALSTATTTQTAIQETATVATEAGTVATWGMSTAVYALALPITAVVAVIALIAKGMSELDPILDDIEQGFAFLTGSFSKFADKTTDFFKENTVAEGLAKIANAVLHPIDTFKSLSKEVAKAGAEMAKLKEQEQGIEDLKDINEVRNKNLESEIKRDQIRLKNKSLSASEIAKIEARLESNFQKISENKIDINNKELDLAYKTATVNNSRLSALEKQKLAQSIKNGDLELANQLLNAGKLKTSEYDILKEKVNLASDTNNELGEMEERLQDKINKANDKAEARRAKAKEQAVKAEADRQKRLQDLIQSTYELDKQRLEQNIVLNEEISKNEKLSDEERIQAVYNSQQTQEDLLKVSMKRELSEQNVTAKDKIRINEKYAFDLIQLNKKTIEEVNKINAFDEDKYKSELDKKTLASETAMNNDLIIENERFNALSESDKLLESETEKHEKKILEIKKRYAIEQAKIQIDGLEKTLEAFKLESDDSEKSQQFILQKEKEISDAKLKLTELEKSATKENKEALIKDLTEIADVVSNGLRSGQDLANAIFAGRIQNLEEEIDKNNEFYDKQSEMAGDDERQKKEIEKERELRNKEVEKKIAKEKEKQAKIDKAVTIAQIAIATALAIVKAAPNPVLMTLSAVTGAIALAAAIATPLPKFKDGTKNAPGGLAIVGDGGRAEVITDASGNNPMLTPSTDTLVSLNRGDMIHKSIEDFNAFRLAQMKKSGNIQNIYNDDKLISEMRMTRKAIEKQKLNVNLQTQKIDVSHLIWASKQRNWNS